MKINVNNNGIIAKLNKNNSEMKKNSEKLSSGKKINHASDDVAGQAIAEKLEALINGIGKGINNTYDMKNALSVASGGLSSVSESLQRIRDLSLQASNGVLTKDDKAIIQEEINANLEGISDIVSNTQFNGQNLLDGSFSDKNVANGSNMSVSISSTTLNTLGIDGFDITNGGDISAIDKALSNISTTSTKIGASINRFDYSISSNEDALLNQISAKSKIVDTDMAKQSALNKMNEALVQYGLFAQKNTMNSQANLLSSLF